MSLKNLIDIERLNRFKDKISQKINSKAEATTNGGPAIKSASILMGKLDSTSTSKVMTAQIDGLTQLYDGVCIWLYNGVVTSASGVTLNINNLGAKPLYSSLAQATRSTTIFNISYTLLLIYNSTRVENGCWDVVYGIDTNTNTIGYQLRTNSTTMPMSQITYRYRLLFTSADDKKFVPANTNSSTNATSLKNVNQTPINPFGKILYYGTTSSVSEGVKPSTSYLWIQYNITLGYSFNKTGEELSLLQYQPVYIKATPQIDGSAVIDNEIPFVQELPSINDNKIYIFLGIASSSTTVELFEDHPVYCYRNGMIQKWTALQMEVDSLKARIEALESNIN